MRIWTDWPLARYRQETGDNIAQEEFERRIVEDADFAAAWGDLGPVYGKQWVDWPVYEPAENGLFRRREKGINQIAALVESLKNNPGSRRHIFEGCNVAELDQMALPPCHKTYQFQVADGKLSGLLFQRSCDLALGFPFNIFALALLTRMLADQTGLIAHEIIWQGGMCIFTPTMPSWWKSSFQGSPKARRHCICCGNRAASLTMPSKILR